MSLTLTNQYPGLAQGPIDHNASSIVNLICGDSQLLVGEVVRILPDGTGEGFTPPDELLPRVGIVQDENDPIFGVIVGGDFDGIYRDGEITIGLESGIIAAFLGDGVRVCLQGRCLAIADGSLGTFQIGDALSASNGVMKIAIPTDNVIAKALQSSSTDNNIIAVDVQREGVFSDGTWAFKKELTVEAGDVTGASPLVDFPLLVSITDTNLRDEARSNGFDIFFSTDSDGTTVIPYERESYDSSTGTLVAWVLTDLSDIVDNTIFMFYGNPTAPDQQDPLPVWNTRFNDVYHFNQNNFPWLNSSVGGDFNFQFVTGASKSVDGQISTSATSGNSSIGGFFVASSNTPATPTDWYISMWVKLDVANNSTIGFYFNFISSNAPSLGRVSTDMEGVFPVSNLVVDVTGELGTTLIGDVSDMAFHHMVLRYTSSSSTLDIFFDGSLVSSPVFTPTNPFDFSTLRCGNSAVNTREGRNDELQIAYTSSFSNGFIQTSFDNQKDGDGSQGQGAGNFVKVGAQQPV